MQHVTFFIATVALLIHVTAVSARQTPIPTTIYLPLVYNSAPHVEALDNHSYYADRDTGELVFAGEVRNNTDAYVREVSVALNITSGGVSTDVVLPEVFDYLPPDALACYAVEYDGSPNVDSYVVSDFFEYRTSDSRSESLTVRDVLGAINGDGNFELGGVLENEYDFTVDNIYLNGALYNSAGAVISCVTTAVLGLQPGEQRPFQLLYDTRADYTDVAGFRVIGYGVAAGDEKTE
jgi:hypothetical protein